MIDRASELALIARHLAERGAKGCPTAAAAPTRLLHPLQDIPLIGFDYRRRLYTRRPVTRRRPLQHHGHAGELSALARRERRPG